MSRTADTCSTGQSRHPLGGRLELAPIDSDEVHDQRHAREEIRDQQFAMIKILNQRYLSCVQSATSTILFLYGSVLLDIHFFK